MASTPSGIWGMSVQPRSVICDRHRGYPSSQFKRRSPHGGPSMTFLSKLQKWADYLTTPSTQFTSPDTPAPQPNIKIDLAIPAPPPPPQPLGTHPISGLPHSLETFSLTAQEKTHLEYPEPAPLPKINFALPTLKPSPPSQHRIFPVKKYRQTNI